MLYIQIRDPSRSSKDTNYWGEQIIGLTWHVSDNLPGVKTVGDKYVSIQELMEYVSMVEADGHELEWIRENISGIPFSKNAVQSWYGDFARFIASSLPAKY